jgi:hypothetical protein
MENVYVVMCRYDEDENEEDVLISVHKTEEGAEHMAEGFHDDFSDWIEYYVEEYTLND